MDHRERGLIPEASSNPLLGSIECHSGSANPAGTCQGIASAMENADKHSILKKENLPLSFRDRADNSKEVENSSAENNL